MIRPLIWQVVLSLVLEALLSLLLPVSKKNSLPSLSCFLLWILLESEKICLSLLRLQIGSLLADGEDNHRSGMIR